MAADSNVLRKFGCRFNVTREFGCRFKCHKGIWLQIQMSQGNLAADSNVTREFGCRFKCHKGIGILSCEEVIA
jgi:hypothetical protein